MGNAACNGVVASFEGTCNYDNFLAAIAANPLPDGCALADLFPNIEEAEYANTVNALCEYDAPTQFVEIQGTYQKDRRYFAGGGPLVDGDDWSIDAAQITRFEANAGSNTLIAFPEYAARVQYNNDNGLGDNGYPANMNLETSCGLNTVMCCFTHDAMDSFAANGDATTDVCRHDLHDSPQSNHIKEGWSVFPGTETPTHCVGFTWNEGEEELLGNLMYDVSLRNTANKGYKEGIPGAPMCGCVEHMPVVEAASCRTATKDGAITYKFEYLDGYLTADNEVGITYADCANPDLAGQFKANAGGDADKAALIDEHLVAGTGGCADDLEDYLNAEQFLHEGQHPTKYLEPEADKWEMVVGEGIRFLPPSIDPEESDTHFRGLIEAGCQNQDGSARKCIVRRTCSSCNSIAHRDVYYQRLTDLAPFGTNSTAGEVYFLDTFMNQWRNYPDNDMAAGDFALYSTYADALAGTNAWTYCNYDYPGIGFPRDCGPKGYVGGEWNSYTVHGGGNANHHAFYVEKP
ncbi:hypothetical protein ACHAXT_013126 [Thalassiosira profunda]